MNDTQERSEEILGDAMVKALRRGENVYWISTGYRWIRPNQPTPGIVAQSTKLETNLENLQPVVKQTKNT